MNIRIKTPKQIEGIRKASLLTAQTLEHIEQFVKPGISTEELDQICNLFILQNGGRSADIGYLGGNRWGKGPDAYTKYTCISRNDIVCHGTPNKEEFLVDGDIVNIDVSVILGGYFGDASRTFLVGNVSGDAKKLVETTQKCLEVGINQVRPGNYFGNIGYEISQLAKARGYSVVKEYTGHGVGVEFHEDPHVNHEAPKNSGPLMEVGMIFTIEPMINAGSSMTRIDKDGWTVRTRDGKLSAQFEHTILVTETGHEILTVV